MKRLALAAALLLSACATAPPMAMAQKPITPQQAAPQAASISPAGDWHTELNFPPQSTHVGIRIAEASTGVFTGTIGTKESARWDTPLEVTLSNGELSLRNTASGSRFKGRWDAAQQGWAGTYTTGAGEAQAVFTRGMPAPNPIVTGLDGRWEGTLDVQGVKLRLVLRTMTDEHGTAMMMDSPDQAAMGIPAAEIEHKGEAVAFKVPSIRGVWEGAISADGATLDGMWSQGQAFPLIFKRTSTDARLPEPKRPQTPTPPFPYKSEDVAFDNPSAPGVRLACTLTTPETRGKHPVALLITGSGPEDRDETLFGHHIFGALADHLTRKGVGVLRCDDRGFGKSTGTFADATPVEFATDAAAAIAFLRTRADIDPKRIGIIGHSEGSVTGPMVMTTDPNIAFLVMMGGLGATGMDVLAEQRALILGAMGMDDAQVDQVRQAGRMLFAMAANAPDPETAKSDVANFLVLSSAGRMSREDALTQAEAFTSIYMRSLLKYDPATTLPKIKVPVLAITGSKDLQVPAKQNLPLIKSLMKDNPDVTTMEIPNLNHLFQTAKTGSPAEYAEIEETFAPPALDAIADWIVKRMKP